MNNDPFRRSHGVVWILIVIAMSIPVVFIWLTVDGGISGSNWDELRFAILINGGILLTFAYLCSLPIIQLMTKFTDTGIEQPSIFGAKSLDWHEVKEVRNITTGNIVLVGLDTKININPNLFISSQSLMAELRSRIPEGVFPSDSQISQEFIKGKRNDSMRAAIGAYVAVALAFAVGTNEVATIVVGLLFLAYALVETRNWIRYGRQLSWMQKKKLDD